MPFSRRKLRLPAVLLGLLLPLAARAGADVAELFAMRLVTPAKAFAGDELRVRVQLYNPYSLRPLPEIEVEALFELDEDEVRARDRTDPRGEVGFTVALPGDGLMDYVEVTAIARYQGVTREVTAVFYLDQATQVLLGTDKKLYRPGQTLHVRGLWVDAETRPLAAEEVEITISDSRSRDVAYAELATSPFGIASFDWQIPEAASTGLYSIEVSPGDGWAVVRIAPYELPGFRVAAERSRPYYLPGEEAAIEVEVTTLANEPMADVRIDLDPVSEDGDEESVRSRGTAITDAGGHAVLHLDLATAHDHLGPSRPLADHELRVLARDPRSGRTERARVWLRLALNPIQLYLPGTLSAEGRPARASVTASYADGRPATATVEVWQSADGGDGEVLLGRLRTNRYGVARLPETMTPDDDRPFRVAAYDAEGLRGIAEEHQEWRPAPPLVITGPRTLYRRGEPLELTLHTDRPRERIEVEVMRGGELLASRSLERVEGEAEVSFPYRADFAGEVSVVATSLAVDLFDQGEMIAARRTVLYPRDQNILELTVASEPGGYRPGDEARLDLSLSERSPAALGVAVVDVAVEARQQDEGLGAGPALLEDVEHFPGASWWEPELELMGFTAPRLLAILDTPEMLTPELDLVAEILLAQRDIDEPVSSDLSSPIGEERSEHRSFFDTQMQPIAAALNAALRQDTAEPATDEPSLGALLARRGIDLRGLLDPWGSPYCPRFSIEWRNRRVAFLSAGRDRTWDTVDDFRAWSKSWPYARRLGKAIDLAVRRFFEETGGFILTEDVLARELARDGVHWRAERDPWGRPYQFAWRQGGRKFQVHLRSATGDDVHSTWLDFGRYYVRQMRLALGRLREARYSWPQSEAELREILDVEGWRDPWGNDLTFDFVERRRYIDRTIFREPGAGSEGEAMTETVVELHLVSAGADGIRNTDDDRPLGHVGMPLLVRSSSGVAAEAAAGLVTTEAGAFVGVVVDDESYPLPGATVKAVDRRNRREWVTFTDVEGRFEISVPPGVYLLEAELEGFSSVVYPGLEIRRRQVVEVVMTLSISEVYEEIVVTGQAEVGSIRPSDGSRTVPRSRAAPPIATPRLRRDFPETLLWLPEHLTDENGRTTITVPLADNITTWKVAAIASTRDGRVAVAEDELVATQPFYVELDLPPHLTAGDEIGLPIYLHNYSGRGLEVGVEVAADQPVRRTLTLEPSAIERVDVERRFARPGETTVRVTAVGGDHADAVERRAEVGFDGREHVVVGGRLLAGGGTFELTVPDAALAGSAGLEVVVYQGLSDHLVSALRGLRRRPAGCAEQRTSLAAISLMLLETLTARGEGASPEAEEARSDLKLAHDTLAAYRNGGGFGYWPGSRAHLALTAYVVEFLLDARPWIAVDEEFSAAAARWMRRLQRDDGSWPAPGWGATAAAADLRSTAGAALVLSRLAATDLADAEENAEAAGRALAFLKPRLASSPDAYALALYALATAASGDAEAAHGTRDRLRSLAHEEEPTFFWHLQRNTPFWGWGAAGRLETTALVVQALYADREEEALGREAAGGMIYLLLNKDADGAWASTQATVRVLRALSGALPALGATRRIPEVFLDGSSLGKLPAPPAPGLPAPPLVVPLTAGRHHLSLGTVDDAEDVLVLVQTKVRYHLPWDHPTEGSGPAALRYEVACTPSELAIGETGTCELEAERVGFRGYGMMIAEIGLAPGAEVDRGSLDEAMAGNPDVNRYEVWPDRVLFYLWPRAGGTRLRFAWRPRMAMRARSAPSTLYDYYNPTARVVVAPFDYRVTAKRH
ncbi:MAG: hypothetical protein GY856_39315 [bacterium]|nr:hypothetical protein [bacterium]